MRKPNRAVKSVARTPDIGLKATVKHTFSRGLFANDWPIKIFLPIGPILFTVAALLIFNPSPRSFTDWISFVDSGYPVLLAALLGFFCGVLFTPFVIAPLYEKQAKRNGAPFQVGDRVRILAGRHRGRVT